MVAQRQISALKVGNFTRQTRKLCALQQAAEAGTLWTSSSLSAAWESLPAQPETGRMDVFQYIYRYVLSTQKFSVEDPGFGIRCLLIPGSGMGKKSRSWSGTSIPDHISESLETIFLVKILQFFLNLDARSGMEKIRTRDRTLGPETSAVPQTRQYFSP